jgi:hypothetical protein
MTVTFGSDESGRQSFAARSDDAGAMLRSLGVSDQIVGGRIEVTGATDEAQPGKPLALNVAMRNFRVIDEPAIVKFLAVALITGLADAQKDGIGFERLDGRGLLRGSVLELQDLRSRGPALGILAKGRIDLDADTIDMEGTIVPANAVNSLIGRIPLIGEVLFGPGLFAARYTVKGSRKAPDVSVNLLSGLAPGVLRNIFGVLEGGQPLTPVERNDSSR